MQTRLQRFQFHRRVGDGRSRAARSAWGCRRPDRFQFLRVGTGGCCRLPDRATRCAQNDVGVVGSRARRWGVEFGPGDAGRGGNGSGAFFAEPVFNGRGQCVDRFLRAGPRASRVTWSAKATLRFMMPTTLLALADCCLYPAGCGHQICGPGRPERPPGARADRSGWQVGWQGKKQGAGRRLPFRYRVMITVSAAMTSPLALPNSSTWSLLTITTIVSRLGACGRRSRDQIRSVWPVRTKSPLCTWRRNPSPRKATVSRPICIRISRPSGVARVRA